MGLFKDLFKPKDVKNEFDVKDFDIVAIADGELVDVSQVQDEVFSQQMMGKSIAFQFQKDKVTLCSPANGTLETLFPTGHAFGVKRNDGVEILIHCGVDTVSANGDGFTLLKKKQGDPILAGEPIVEVDMKKLSALYDMSTMLIITNDNGQTIEFIDPQSVVLGQSVLR